MRSRVADDLVRDVSWSQCTKKTWRRVDVEVDENRVGVSKKNSAEGGIDGGEERRGRGENMQWNGDEADRWPPACTWNGDDRALTPGCTPSGSTAGSCP